MQTEVVRAGAPEYSQSEDDRRQDDPKLTKVTK